VKEGNKFLYKPRAIAYEETAIISLWTYKLCSEIIIINLAQKIASSIQVYKIEDKSSSMADGAASIAIEPGKPAQVKP
jgi:hypothetical protein